jgi:hypothetical protein
MKFEKNDASNSQSHFFDSRRGRSLRWALRLISHELLFPAATQSDGQNLVEIALEGIVHLSRSAHAFYFT